MFCWHKYAVRGVILLYSVRAPFGVVIDGAPSCPLTEVLEVCRCRKYRTRTLDGHWTLEQLMSTNTTPFEILKENIKARTKH